MFLVFAVFPVLLLMWPPSGFVSALGTTAWTVFAGMLVLMFLSTGLGFVLRSGVWLRVTNLVAGLGFLPLSPLLVQQGLQSGQSWVLVLGVLFAPAGVWGIWVAYRGRYSHLWWRRVVTFDQLVGR